MFTFGITFYKNGEKTIFVSGRQQRILQEKSTSEQDNDEELSLRLQDCKEFVKEEPDQFNKNRKTFCSYQKFLIFYCKTEFYIIYYNRVWKVQNFPYSKWRQ